MSTELDMLKISVNASAQRVAKLRQSVAKVQHLFPLGLPGAAALTDDEEESIDALILRYSQCVSMIQDQLFRGIAYLEQEDISDKSNRDKSLLMERLGAIQSAEDFGTAAMLRNKFSHHYPEESFVRLQRLNLAVDESRFVISTFENIVEYLQRKGFN
ncbi:MAG: hypothetical protein IPN53_17195 [Comamonadaceae bacterium]|nr:hypothetical protein [Comamonadaceae bacterium]